MNVGDFLITINIKYYGKKAKEFAREMERLGYADIIRNRDGNIKYEYYIPLNSDDYILLIDSWENQEALDIHHHSDVFKKIVELREKYDLKMEVERFSPLEENKEDLKYIIKR